MTNELFIILRKVVNCCGARALLLVIAELPGLGVVLYGICVYERRKDRETNSEIGGRYFS